MRRSGGRERGRGEVKLREGVAYCLQRKVVVGGWWVGGMEGITERVLINQTFSISNCFFINQSGHTGEQLSGYQLSPTFISSI